jgi:hypothetical protein
LRRDPNHLALLAPAIHVDLPVWSNDQDFDGGVEWYTTEKLLRQLGIRKAH